MIREDRIWTAMKLLGGGLLVVMLLMLFVPVWANDGDWEMMNNFWPIAVQTALIALAVLASYVSLRERITALEVTSRYQGDSIDRMVGQVDGLSRHVATLDGRAESH